MRIIPILLVVLLFTACDIMADTKVENEVLKALQADSRTSGGTDYAVSFDGKTGTVTITGEVFDGAMFDAVKEVAEGIEGVKLVINKTRIPDTSNGMMQDTVVPSPFL